MNFKNSVKVSPGPCGLKQHKSWIDVEGLFFYIKGNRLKCSDYNIQTRKT